MLSRRVFDGLGDKPDVDLAWKLVGKEVASGFGGEPLIPIPFFSTKKSPCAPGFVALKRERTFTEWITRQPKKFLFTECLWDFQPTWVRNHQILRSSSKMENNEQSFVYERVLTKKKQNKAIKIVFSGKEISSLDESPGGMPLDLEAFEDSYFHDFEIYLVDKVVSINRGFVEVTIDDKTARTELESRYPIGFTMMKLTIGYTGDIGKVEAMSKVNTRKWRGDWLDRTEFRIALHQVINNQRKYGGAAGDVLGATDSPFNFLNR